MPADVATRMEYIQKVFLGVQNYMQNNPGLEELLVTLDTEPPEFRSVAYEAASMEIGLWDLEKGDGLHEWQTLYICSKKAHSFHLEIGLGWAFAKQEISPEPYLGFMDATMHRMVYDGIGYYNGLFRGRRTIRHHEVPPFVPAQYLAGFDQGLGRRLWYISLGVVPEVVRLVTSFPEARQADMWRGVGIACGYVGGNSIANLKSLLNASGSGREHLCTGVEWAAISRKSSGSINTDIESACLTICKTSIHSIHLRLQS